MMRRCTSVLLSAAALTALAGSNASIATAATDAASVETVPASLNELPDRWFVELASPPGVEGTRGNVLRREKAEFRAAAAGAGIKFTERYSFDTLWNGMSIDVASSDVSGIKRLPGVKAVYPVAVIDREPMQSLPAPDLATAIVMTGADIAQSHLGYTGEGIKVAVMDTGIDVDHPDLGGDGVPRNDSILFPTARVAYGYDFVGDDFNADPDSPTYNPVPTPDPNPDDCGGHGTHVSGIVGANGAVKGVAPDVTFGAYRVFGCDGSTTADIMIAAMERALADGMQILNMSIGSAFQWPQYPTAAASDRLVNAGVVVVTSIGNSGTSGLYAAGAPGVGKKVIGTASFDNSHVFLTYFTVNGANIGYVPMTFAGPTPTSGTEEIVYIGTACNGVALEANPAGIVALAARGGCSFNEKATNAINAGASAVVIHNNAAGVFNGTLGSPIDGVTPVVGISLADGLYIRAQGAPVTMTWTDQQASFPNPTGGLISSFSSYGLAPDLSLKPDIGAPGGNIYSTYPLEQGGYATISGTSMASPHVAGAAALMLQAHPRTNSQVMRTILQNSADPAVWFGNPGLGFLDNVHRQGAGMVDVDDAILATTKVEPGKIAAGEGESGPYVQTLEITNSGDADVTYDLSYVNALSTGGIITPSFFVGNASVSFSSANVAVAGGGTASVIATITPATSPTNGQYGGYIVLTPQGGGQVYRVPYAGFVGDYQGIQVLAPTGNGFPWLARLSGTSYIRLTDPADWTFTLADGDVPYFLAHFDHHPEKFRVAIYDAKGKAWHRAYDDRYLPRNSSTTSFFAFPFDGQTVNGKKVNSLPDGTYYAVMSVLKANGDDENPAHWESWTSPLFTIDRP